MKGLTERQKEILNLIKSDLRNKGFPPTRADIANALGFKSPNAAEQHLRALEKKVVIKILSGASRGILLHKEKDSGIPIVGLVAAGQPLLAEENIEDKIKIPTNMFKKSVDYLLRVKGSSMIDLGIHENDLVAVKKEKECREGQIIIARINEEVTVKTFRIDGEGQVILESANPDYKNIKINPEKEDFFLEGICVGVIKSF